MGTEDGVVVEIESESEVEGANVAFNGCAECATETVPGPLCASVADEDEGEFDGSYELEDGLRYVSRFASGLRRAVSDRAPLVVSDDSAPATASSGCEAHDETDPGSAAMIPSI